MKYAIIPILREVDALVERYNKERAEASRFTMGRERHYQFSALHLIRKLAAANGVRNNVQHNGETRDKEDG